MQCANCGHQLTTGASFCGNCGVAVTHAQPPLPPQHAPSQHALSQPEPSHHKPHHGPHHQQQPAAAPMPAPIQAPHHQQTQTPGGYPGVQPVQLHPSSKYNEMAIIAAIMIVIFPPVSAILGFIALGQIKQSHEQGRTIAIFSIVLGMLTILLFIAFVALIIAFPDSGNSYD